MQPTSVIPRPLEAPVLGTDQAAPVVTPRGMAKFSSNRDVAVVQADYLALANDLEQAHALSSTLEMQLSGKTNELAQFKLIWERTQADLAKFAQDLDTMRKERHSLANEVQCAYALEHTHEKLKVAHETLQNAHEALQTTYELAVAKADRLETDLQRERAIHVQTRLEADELRVKASSRLPAMGQPRDAELRRSLEALREQLDRVLAGSPANPAAHSPAPARAEVEHIAIEFCT